mmetsp:Transcript_42391/g.68750  ORF Transcript_42391/g.68750 Transcript_42391/m.68750 type:complete len:286 (-) Transcript_42391:251-1108(-)|eukprot:CAMPEP_0184675874 /NCGR_PEP_ID=MMETSP0308-20130426/88047_1 /TAXON_ID=38269 /ORGANISM="Gloeochaete witrockiana, Strain SAG 46.84" /LENGTH=285 /DNA_ID=CAMNT_0027123659 /DNA_START=1299 /DNA_END=2156 /DNA_ORIENTATION=+
MDNLPVDLLPPLPLSPKSQVLWKTISAQQLRDLLALKDPEQSLRLLAEVLQIDDHATHERSAILLDFHFYNLMFAKDSGFSHEKISIFFTLMRDVLENAIVNHLKLEEAFAYFQRRLLTCCVVKEPGSFKLFSAEDVKLITNYVTSGFFQHYRLYMYVFTHEREKQIVTQQVYIETAPAPETAMETLPVEVPGDSLDLNGKISPEDTANRLVHDLELKTGAGGADIRKLVTDAVAQQIADLRANIQKEVEENFEAKLLGLEARLSVHTTEEKPRSRQGGKKGAAA